MVKAPTKPATEAFNDQEGNPTRENVEAELKLLSFRHLTMAAPCLSPIGSCHPLGGVPSLEEPTR